MSIVFFQLALLNLSVGDQIRDLVERDHFREARTYTLFFFVKVSLAIQALVVVLTELHLGGVLGVVAFAILRANKNLSVLDDYFVLRVEFSYLLELLGQLIFVILKVAVKTALRLAALLDYLLATHKEISNPQIGVKTQLDTQNQDEEAKSRFHGVRLLELEH